MMRIAVHDYCGHPFQVQLSRELAQRGNIVRHYHFADFPTPKAHLCRRSGDHVNFDVQGIELPTKFNKYSLLQRRAADRKYGKVLSQAIGEFDPDCIISANCPLDAQLILQNRFKKKDVAFIIWLQDILSFGISKLLDQKLSVVGRLLGSYFWRMERSILQSTDGVVCISNDFVDVIEKMRISRQQVDVIENWAPLDELVPFSGNPSWPHENGLGDDPFILYSGTLGLKHNPQLLAGLTKSLEQSADYRDTKLVVISEGLGADWLENERRVRNLRNLKILPFQPFDRLSEIFSSAQVLLGVIERDAGVFSVPSKILSYLCVGRPIVLAAPGENLAARTVQRAGAGRVVASDDVNGFVSAVFGLLADESQREHCGKAGRLYAEATFDISRICDEFERVIETSLARRRAPLSAMERGGRVESLGPVAERRS